METEHKKLLLVVDDDPDQRLLLCHRLQDVGYVTLEAGSATDALGLCDIFRLDAVITDAQMPGMNGFELVRWLRAIPRLAHMPIILVTAYQAPCWRAAARDVGATAYLDKTADWALLALQIGGVVGTPSAIPDKCSCAP